MKRSLQVISILLIISLFSLSSSCGKGNEHDTIPNVAVNISFDVNSTMYINLSMVGGHEYLVGGYKGIVVYRVGADEFVAYDRACSHDPLTSNSRLIMDPSSSFILTDTVCGSSFLILDGSVNSGPATLPLKRYQTSFDGTYLSIYN